MTGRSKPGSAGSAVMMSPERNTVARSFRNAIMVRCGGSTSQTNWTPAARYSSTLSQSPSVTLLGEMTSTTITGSRERIASGSVGRFPATTAKSGRRVRLRSAPTSNRASANTWMSPSFPADPSKASQMRRTTEAWISICGVIPISSPSQMCFLTILPSISSQPWMTSLGRATNSSLVYNFSAVVISAPRTAKSVGGAGINRPARTLRRR